MKVTISRSELSNALALAGGVIKSRTPKPVLGCVKLSATASDRLAITATDLEAHISITTSVVDVERTGEVAIPADRLLAIANATESESLSIEAEGDVAHVKTESSKFKVFTVNASEFPPCPAPEGEATFTLPGEVVRGLLKRTAYAASDEASRYAFDGVQVVAGKGKVEFVATDGRRLAWASAPCVTNQPKTSAIVPLRVIGLVSKLADNDEDVSWFIGERQVTVKAGGAQMTTQIVEGTFPPYDDFIPKENDHLATASREALLGAVRNAAVMVSEESKGVRFRFGKHGLEMTSRAPEKGEAVVGFPCKFEGGDIEIGFNPAYVMEALRALDGDEVVVEMTVPNRPGVIRCGRESLCVVMPVNLF